MRWVKRLLVLVLIITIGFGVYSVWTVRRSFPNIDGTVAVAGLETEVEVFRDGLGVPNIYASNRHDLFFAQGYVHAQDRFWQMDFWRHIGSGRLSELFGESQLETDLFLRTLGFERIAEKEWERAGSPVTEILQAYADGVNAYIANRSGPEISLEYAVLPLENSDYEIAPWTPIHTLTWAKVMSWDLSGNMSSEISRATLGQTLEPDDVDRLHPAYPDDKPHIIDAPGADTAEAAPEMPATAVAALTRASRAANELWDLTGGGFEGIGSNSWVVAGELTESGMPLLANDTHLGIRIPSIWYENGLHCTGVDCPFKVTGFTFPGVPGVVIGHNERIAWGVTTEAADTQDLYIERVNPADPDQYEVDGEWVDFDIRVETIEVAGAEDVELIIRSSSHGPVISETFFGVDGPFDDSSTVALPMGDYVVSLAWPTLRPSTLASSVIALNTAGNHTDFIDALSRWDIAAQNFVYADVDGNIAYQSTGEIPIRPNGDGRFPMPGWDSANDWTGVVAFEQMPGILNPGSGFVATANQPIWDSDRLPFIGSDGASGYRAGRIVEMLETTSPHNVASTQRLQLDGRDGSAEFVVPHLISLDSRGARNIRDLQTRLDGWATGSRAYQAVGDSSGAAIYMATWRHILANTFHDDLPESQWPTGGGRWFEVVRLLLEEPDNSFWDDSQTSERETRDDILHRSLLDADMELRELLGDDPGKWRWGDLHTATFEHQSLGQSGVKPIEWLFNRSAPGRVGGSTSIVNAVGWDTSASYAVDWLPSQRLVMDLSDWSASTFVHTTGQSGHAFHENYDSMIEMWTDGEYTPMLWEKGEISRASTDLLLLVPERS